MFFLILLVSLVSADLIFNINSRYYLLIIFFYSAILFYGAYFIGSNFYIYVLCSTKTNEKLIALSFDDGPSQYTPRVLEILDRENVRASFFCIGKKIHGNEKVLNDIIGSGHLIGNHSYSHHFLFDVYSSKKMMCDLEQMSATMHSITGLRPKLFRPPYGVTNPNLSHAIKKGNYIPVGWNIRSMDTVIKDEHKLLKKVVSRIAPGNIFLFHDTMETTVKMLPAFIHEAKNKGFKIVRIDELLNIQAYE